MLRQRAHARDLAAPRRGSCGTPLQFSFIVGVLGGIPAHVGSRCSFRRRSCPLDRSGEGHRDQPWTLAHAWGRGSCSAATSAQGWRTISTCLPGGEMARSNGDLCEVAARMIRDVGRRPATVEEARQILGLGAAA
ncbi:MAG: 3-keto-5-aminohexanoate cleavage protein [Polyangiaceae bacterium]